MKGRVNGRKSVGGVGRIALTVCIGVLIVVFVMAYVVGIGAANPRKARLMESSRQLLERRKAELGKCMQMRDTYLNGDQLSAAQLIESLQGRTAAARESLRLEKEREASMRSVVQRCRDELKDLRNKSYGTPAGGIKAQLAELEKRRLALMDQHESLTNIKEMHRRSDLMALQKALVQKLAEMQRQPVGPDPATVCNKSPVMFSVVFDIGSSGNRVHVYKYALKAPTDGAPTVAPSLSAVARAPTAVEQRDVIGAIALKEEFFQKNYEALTKLPNPVKDAPGALRELFDGAKAFVSPHLHVCTPVEFKATAGLRSLGAEKAAEVLRAIRREYANEALWLRGSAPVRILGGSEEGPMAWLTVNFLLGAFEMNSGNATVAVIDVGGGSTQMVFEPGEGAFLTLPAHQQFTARLGRRPVRAYQHSYEGFGLHAATHELLSRIQVKPQTKPLTETSATMQSMPSEWQQQQGNTFSELFGSGDDTAADSNDDAEEAVADPQPDPAAMEAFPCFAVGYIDPLGVSNTKKTEAGVPVTGPNFAACVKLFRDRILKPENEPCPVAHCGIGKTPQPPLAAFTGDIYVLSFVYDLLSAASATSLAVSSEKFMVRLADLEQIGTRRCTALTLNSIKEATVDSSLQPAYDCMYYSYAYALLKYGYGIPEERQLHVAKSINGYEMAWTLGASLISLSQ
ncbi:putative nucleoside phosphatase putative guanosine diphosphatase [Leptomonas seymouri]|uniref:Putative nucleoside phosphatase putative guanosine diphosphatase n=1 Tax=Leptomonas seymouri TaxID=5684 RepID=A0A0N1I0E8_LEPSE|nr:putative nucleoside phosphatase putative guanosine diphosphatase [Leptomonas seymouri]|eukprot:KPI88118.1 putative nucleoside phosphatase putative guanosine diphosphatase [Leptomonas seymouri]